MERAEVRAEKTVTLMRLSKVAGMVLGLAFVNEPSFGAGQSRVELSQFRLCASEVPCLLTPY